ncbi:hypothetical protein NT6N_26950 [Oceaniferula spumae]|uniref:DUF218 domain-containing protein n=1 Tax=Oceaniferula spumae TaxID=2979115 RepID=A0AAT9FNX7_9BACT
MKLLSKKWIKGGLLTGFLFTCLAGWWIGWGGWPDPEAEEFPWTPDVILVLGGGNEERPREAIRLHKIYPDVPLLVTGDGGMIYDALLAGGVDESDIIHETKATSTIENAELTATTLTKLRAQRVVLVTNWFHGPRSMAVFDRYQPDREFVLSFEPKPDQFSNWHRYATRRERLAALLYVVRYGIWSF